MMRIHGQTQTVHDAVMIVGNTLRLGILHELRKGPAIRGAIAASLGVTEDNLSRQMTMLVDHGLVTATTLRGRGRPIEFALNVEAADRLWDNVSRYYRGES
ncbi:MULTISPECIES: ArsR/SmtB family transcription factor [Kocuria]|uniref:ArsR/SmtB family transcription factor n=2 Tax=Actinomycetes TaxID=1760 RepID=UPI00073D2C36|nr:MULTISPECIES: winged helix-turn-helix domain-containing protein [Kocuria]MDA4829705.1 winged helix-turn-helix domain-containing protein [Kocuria rhizophila]MXN63182.1 helix-turn-helix domain-containing protein [Bacillus sp. BGMRC0062]